MAEGDPDTAPTGETGACERAGIERLFRSSGPALERRLRARLPTAEDARDLVQDAFARLIDARGPRPLRRPEAFLNRIVRNLLIDRSRRARERATHVEVGAAAGEMPPVPALQHDALEFDELRARYRTAVSRLPPRMREVFVLHRVEELGFREIAARLDISVRTVEWHFAEAIVRLSKALEDE